MFELSFATAGQESARSVSAWQRPDVLVTPLAEPQVSLRAPLVRPLVLSVAPRPSRVGVSFKRPA